MGASGRETGKNKSGRAAAEQLQRRKKQTASAANRGGAQRDTTESRNLIVVHNKAKAQKVRPFICAHGSSRRAHSSVVRGRAYKY